MAHRNNRTRKTSRWDHAVSLLQQARHDRRWPQYQACQVIQQACPGHFGKPCRLNASKLSDWENRKKPPSLIHVQAMCEVYVRHEARCLSGGVRDPTARLSQQSW